MNTEWLLVAGCVWSLSGISCYIAMRLRGYRGRTWWHAPVSFCIAAMSGPFAWTYMR